MKEALKIGVSGVRGVVGDSFTPQLAAAFAQAFGTFVGHGSVVVGRDTRPSGQMIEMAVIAGLQSVGCKPVLAGIVPTPTLLILARELGARGGIAITASHNPGPWNALKFIDRRGLFLDAVRADELFDIYHQQDFPLVQEAEIPSVVAHPAPMDAHIARIRDYVDVEAIRRRAFTVAVDCCNGVGALYSVGLLRDVFGCRVVAVHDAPTGLFERDPEPLPENLGALCDAVRREKCDIGFAQDPDGDRLAIVTEQGEALGEELTLAFAVQQVLEHHAKGPVVVNLSTGKSVDHVAAKFGCEVIRTRIGETHVADAMLKAGAVVGGENTGGVMIPPIHPCRDSFAAMAILLELLACSRKTISGLRAGIPSFVSVRDKVAIRTERAPEILRALRRDYAGEQMNFLDGVFIDFGESWIHVRRSNTEPVIRITAEATTRDRAEALVRELRAKIDPLGR
jgi:phosphomannomutase